MLKSASSRVLSLLLAAILPVAFSRSALSRKIDQARRDGATKFDLSCRYDAKDSEKLTELPESLGQLMQLQTLNLFNNRLTALR